MTKTAHILPVDPPPEPKRPKVTPAQEEGREPKRNDHPADVASKDAERPLAERVEIAAGFPPKQYGER